MLGAAIAAATIAALSAFEAVWLTTAPSPSSSPAATAEAPNCDGVHVSGFTVDGVAVAAGEHHEIVAGRSGERRLIVKANVIPAGCQPALDLFWELSDDLGEEVIGSQTDQVVVMAPPKGQTALVNLSAWQRGTSKEASASFFVTTLGK